MFDGSPRASLPSWLTQVDRWLLAQGLGYDVAVHLLPKLLRDRELEWLNAQYASAPFASYGDFRERISAAFHGPVAVEAAHREWQQLSMVTRPSLSLDEYDRETLRLRSLLPGDLGAEAVLARYRQGLPLWLQL